LRSNIGQGGEDSTQNNALHLLAVALEVILPWFAAFLFTTVVCRFPLFQISLGMETFKLLSTDVDGGCLGRM